MSQRALTELLRGKGAHVDPLACVEDLSSELASRRIEGFPHSIAELVFHMSYWMGYELTRIHGGKPHYPQHNSESFPPQQNLQDWDELRRCFLELLAEFEMLSRCSPTELERTLESIHEGDKKVSGTLESVLWQMVAHNSYHIGQIALIRRTLGAWPPRAGGDTW